MTALHVFDMDGTLLRGTTASVELSRRLGCLEPLLELEAQFLAEQITAGEFAVGIHGLWTELSPALVAEVAAGAPWIDGIAEVCEDIAARGEHSLLITMSPDFFARHLLALGVDVVCASQFPPVPFAQPVDPSRILNPADKVRLAARERIALGLAPEDCVAYGDSISDMPLFGELPHTVAVNGDAPLEALAAVAYRGDTLVEAYALGRGLLARR